MPPLPDLSTSRSFNPTSFLNVRSASTTLLQHHPYILPIVCVVAVFLLVVAGYCLYACIHKKPQAHLEGRPGLRPLQLPRIVAERDANAVARTDDGDSIKDLLPKAKPYSLFTTKHASLPTTKLSKRVRVARCCSAPSIIQSGPFALRTEDLADNETTRNDAINEPNPSLDCYNNTSLPSELASPIDLLALNVDFVQDTCVEALPSLCFSDSSAGTPSASGLCTPGPLARMPPLSAPHEDESVPMRNEVEKAAHLSLQIILKEAEEQANHLSQEGILKRAQEQTSHLSLNEIEPLDDTSVPSVQVTQNPDHPNAILGTSPVPTTLPEPTFPPSPSRIPCPMDIFPDFACPCKNIPNPTPHDLPLPESSDVGVIDEVLQTLLASPKSPKRRHISLPPLPQPLSSTPFRQVEINPCAVEDDLGLSHLSTFMEPEPEPQPQPEPLLPLDSNFGVIDQVLQNLRDSPKRRFNSLPPPSRPKTTTPLRQVFSNPCPTEDVLGPSHTLERPERGLVEEPQAVQKKPRWGGGLCSVRNFMLRVVFWVRR